ncbi:MAG: hypothetical protein ACREBU_07455 [Nitrososphaera sp.]
MGTRSMNFLAIKAGHILTQEVSKYLQDAVAGSSKDGTLYIFESNFTPMWARDGNRIMVPRPQRM